MSEPTVYVKHPVLGNEHVSEAEACKREAEGWVRWPRPWAVKNAAPQENRELVAVSLVAPATPDGAAPAKRGPGRPRKAAA